MSKKLKVGGQGLVLPPGQFTPVAELPDGQELTVTIEEVTGENDHLEAPSECFMVRCAYPDGFTKHHQVKTVEELAQRVVIQLRSRYGAGEVSFSKLPKSLAAGEQFIIGA